MFRILYVCTGNTCRSPIAEGLLKKALVDKGIAGVAVSSAGIGTLDGYPATSHAVQAAKAKGVDISEHHSQRMSSDLAAEADLIFALAENHYDYMQRYEEAVDRIFMVKAFPEKGHADGLHSVKDPIGADYDEYKQVTDELEREIKRALPAILERIKVVSK